jgi:hypothetical protein
MTRQHRSQGVLCRSFTLPAEIGVRTGISGVVIGLIALFALGLLTSPVVAGEKVPKSGGSPKIAWVGEPPTLDIHTFTTASTRRLAEQRFERLFTVDEQYNPIPELAEGHDVSPDGKMYTGRSRGGVLFQAISCPHSVRIRSCPNSNYGGNLQVYRPHATAYPSRSSNSLHLASDRLTRHYIRRLE